MVAPMTSDQRQRQVESHKIKLLTVLNAQAARPARLKRHVDPERDWYAIAKRVKLQQAARHEESGSSGKATAVLELPLDKEDKVAESEQDAFSSHFAPESALLSALEHNDEAWRSSSADHAVVGRLTTCLPSGSKGLPSDKSTINPTLLDKLKTYGQARYGSQTPATAKWLSETLASYLDVSYTTVDLDERDALRAAAAMHAMNHIYKTRSKVLKNNEYLAKKEETLKGKERETRDQGFTRPKVLVLLPLRNAALAWVKLLTQLSLAAQVDNAARLDKDFGLPEDAIDRLAEEGTARYPADHVETFKGNIDDEFRMGIKVTRKAIRYFSEFYSSDIIVASPLGLRTAIEKEDDADFLSSIEIVLADQLDVMSMQNWEHVQFVFKHLNQIPKESHGCDFARVKPWYLDGKAAQLRQTVLLSSLDLPEHRSLFGTALTNRAGKLRTERAHEGTIKLVTSGIKQVFDRFEVSDMLKEDDERFQVFTQRTLPMLTRSAVASSNTLIFVPSYFDFIRVKQHLRKSLKEELSFAAISEYSTNSEVARARTLFFQGKVNFLLLTERFHFFKRYRIRGAKTICFYALPDHPQFYSEYLSYPFHQREDQQNSSLDPSEVTAFVSFSRFDYLRLERIVGTEDARRMVMADDTERFTFM
ncbi:uncharacterized protein L969DRAFT_83896 [Mixia osmundae IAM 14324]|uniref:U3 small nucleolar RNA-associated protein 25 n=1 Tax=Mixia osmundae (strain CBS 9802 / IAM 14324 / JCM 22182 / KY 12970) TaxID=764103 RepID=G7DVD2_MIXOS|nr:uncharacterized protein L969DRAFT_83896 [Mixia osmundae IAM 14324]KEI42037.1 hypothetical protein L969DRAFT_83896 [Mixia osmundae IAM 14324]GAA94542.1 hypothetical protein E5Q_01194 [Mixia osmundae IAM 14324]